jgi:hypothetical protein
MCFKCIYTFEGKKTDKIWSGPARLVEGVGSFFVLEGVGPFPGLLVAQVTFENCRLAERIESSKLFTFENCCSLLKTAALQSELTFSNPIQDSSVAGLSHRMFRSIDFRKSYPPQNR